MQRGSSPAQRGSAAKAAVVRLARIWGLDADDASALTGTAPDEWDMWLIGGGTQPSDAQLDRIGQLLAIYADLHAMHGRELADQWVSRPNSNNLFGGRTPVEVMVEGGTPAIEAVRGLLDQRRYT